LPPYARRGALWETYKRHYGPNGDPAILVAQGATRDLNPDLPQSIIDRAMDRDAAAASAEYIAQFRTDVEAFITREAVEACTNAGVFERPPDRKHSYVGFVDPSGGSSDAMTLAIAHTEGKTQIPTLYGSASRPFRPKLLSRNMPLCSGRIAAPRFTEIGTAVNGRGSNSRSATSTMNPPRNRNRNSIGTFCRSSTRVRPIFLRTSASLCSSPS
jgi:hypothetical protein